MSNADRHEMKPGKSYPSGAQEWICPACGRWIVMHHLPEQGKLKVIVLQDGDEEASHAGSRGGIRQGDVRVTEQAAAERSAPAARPLLH